MNRLAMEANVKIVERENSTKANRPEQLRSMLFLAIAISREYYRLKELRDAIASASTSFSNTVDQQTRLNDGVRRGYTNEEEFPVYLNRAEVNHIPEDTVITKTRQINSMAKDYSESSTILNQWIIKFIELRNYILQYYKHYSVSPYCRKILSILNITIPHTNWDGLKSMRKTYNPYSKSEYIPKETRYSSKYISIDAMLHLRHYYTTEENNGIRNMNMDEEYGDNKKKQPTQKEGYSVVSRYFPRPDKYKTLDPNIKRSKENRLKRLIGYLQNTIAGKLMLNIRCINQVELIGHGDIDKLSKCITYKRAGTNDVDYGFMTIILDKLLRKKNSQWLSAWTKDDEINDVNNTCNIIEKALEKIHCKSTSLSVAGKLRFVHAIVRRTVINGPSVATVILSKPTLVKTLDVEFNGQAISVPIYKVKGLWTEYTNDGSFNLSVKINDVYYVGKNEAITKTVENYILSRNDNSSYRAYGLRPVIAGIDWLHNSDDSDSESQCITSLSDRLDRYLENITRATDSMLSIRNRIAKLVREVKRVDIIDLSDSQDSGNCWAGTLEFIKTWGLTDTLPHNWDSGVNITGNDIARIWREKKYQWNDLFVNTLRTAVRKSNKARKLERNMIES